MSHRTIALALFCLSLLLVLIGYLLYHRPDLIGLCERNTYCLSQDTFYGIVQPMYLSSRWLPPVFLALVAVGRESFAAWSRVCAPIGIVMLSVILVADPTPDGFFFGLPSRLDVSLALAKTFAVGSLLFLLADYLHRCLTNR